MHWDCPFAFSAAECDAILELAAARAGAEAPVWDGAGYRVDADRRRAVTRLLARADDTAWLFDRLDALFAAAAGRLETAVGPLTEPVQVVEYGAGGHFNSWHSDAGADLHGQRILSLSLELSGRDEHRGGDLEIVPGTVGARRTLERGGARVFPSRALHRVTPVTHGVRRSLVAWTGAPRADRTSAPALSRGTSAPTKG